MRYERLDPSFSEVHRTGALMATVLALLIVGLLVGGGIGLAVGQFIFLALDHVRG